MRKLALVVCLLVSTVAFAQQDNKQNGLFLFVTNPGRGGTTGVGGTYWEGAFGVALQRMFTPHVSGEVTVSRQRQITGNAFIGPTGVVEYGQFVNWYTPVDLTARYHFFTDGSWKPYAGAGVRLIDGHGAGDLTGGVIWQFHRSLGLRFDGKVLLGNQDRYNETFNASIGLAWRF